MIRIRNIRLSVLKDKEKLRVKLLNKLKENNNNLIKYNIVKRSIDARRKNNISYVYTIDASFENEDNILKKFKKDTTISIAPKMNYEYPKLGDLKLNNRPVIVGAGPSGLFAALILAEKGFNPLIIERGKEIKERKKDIKKFIDTRDLNEESNIQFGLGGAGTYSDGKLTTSNKDKHNRFKKVLETFVECGATNDILYKAKPHIGTDKLEIVVERLREKIEKLGGEFRFSTKLTKINIENEKVRSIIVNNSEEINTDLVFLCLGHSARDTFKMLKENELQLEAKNFAIGVRIEHKREMIDKSQYGSVSKIMPPASYKLVTHNKGRNIFTFCMCPGGYVVPASSEKGMLVVNGMSKYSRNGENSNSAILVSVNKDDFNSDDPLAGIEFQRKLEKKAYEMGGSNYDAPIQLVGDFLENKTSSKFKSIKPTYPIGYKFANLNDLLPYFVSENLKEGIKYFGNRLKGFDTDEAILTGIETRTSSPVRITRNKAFESNISGVYPVGEGAGYAGGIMSSSVDGIKTAEKIIQKYSNKF